VRTGESFVEGKKACLGKSINEIKTILASGDIAVAVDPEGTLIGELKPAAVIDAILAKKNLGTSKEMAPLTIALGPGFIAGEDVHYIVETCRGHQLGKIISKGPALKNTGIPGNINGFTEERIIRAPENGRVEVLKDIGSLVKKDEVIARVGKSEVTATMDGMVRGMILHGTEVPQFLKMGDIDPRGEKADFTTISDKANAIAGSVLEILISQKVLP
jgi:xanthine dehydrogenase accessory factor